MHDTTTTPNKSGTAPTSINADLADKIGTYLVRCAQRRLWQAVGWTAGLTGQLPYLAVDPAYVALRDALARYIAALSHRPEDDAWPAIDEYLEYVAVDDGYIVSNVAETAIQIAHDLRMGSRGR